MTPAAYTWVVMACLVATALIGAVNNMLSRSAVLDSANYAEWKTGMNGVLMSMNEIEGVHEQKRQQKGTKMREVML